MDSWTLHFDAVEFHHAPDVFLCIALRLHFLWKQKTLGIDLKNLKWNIDFWSMILKHRRSLAFFKGPNCMSSRRFPAKFQVYFFKKTKHNTFRKKKKKKRFVISTRYWKTQAELISLFWKSNDKLQAQMLSCACTSARQLPPTAALSFQSWPLFSLRSKNIAD